MRYKDRKFHFRGRVVRNDPMVNPSDGWVVGFYYQDLFNGEMKHFIRNSEMIWEVMPETVGKFIGYDTNDLEIYEGDILRNGLILIVVEYDENCCQYVKHIYGVDEVNNAVVDGGTAAFLRGENIYMKKVGNIYDNKEMIRR